MIALGVERTIEQDTAYAIRIMVDIAIKALSAAVNDPTTAIQVLDHLGDTLSAIGRTPGLTDGRVTFAGADGTPRVVISDNRWEDYLSLGVTEIREYGTNSIQVVRRLRAMLEDLQASVLPEYLPAVERELARLDASVAARYGETVDADLASGSDRQGIGGPAVLELGRS
jgi:uncharacterized membrane protein